ncbi:TPA: c-type cytochrome [Campylobacter jejuni]|nr:cytochrome c family protein [Campylobacter jejuni subsp. jejuni 414]HDZ4975922.1 c-type cytochrome [Campylobacter jejuni]HDZ5036165.1 c-type cytochrome [Campylobacter jejuni]HDZ5089442.1 c-type cytochrome [Campylobacter jejuni]HDZ5094123.1 c-type cytochrome [Campylobacter jejuni]
MKKYILLLSLCLSLNLSAKSISDYKVGEELSDKEGVEYFKELSKKPVQEWPNKNLSINDVPKGKQGDLIRYGIDLLSKTESTLGPYGKLKKTNNEINCISCHMDNKGNGLPGTKKHVLPFLNVLNSYPKLDIETMKIVSVEDRIRGMGGTDSHKFPNDSKEMKAILAYFKWLKEAYGVKDGVKLEGTFLSKMDFPNRPANPVHGQRLFKENCVTCHGEKGLGVKNDNYKQGTGHLYPSLLYPEGGHMVMIPFLARFLKSSTHFSTNSKNISNADIVDIAAYVNTGFVRIPMATTENRDGPDTAYSKTPSLKPEYFASPQQILDPQKYIKAKYGPWKNPNYFPEQ